MASGIGIRNRPLVGSNRIIITGGPGSGKSTLIESLREQGFTCYDEVSRELIRQQAQLSNGVMPWNDLPSFARLVFIEMKNQHDQAELTDSLCFFDRGIPDIFGYLIHGGHPVPEEFLTSHAVSCNYHPTAFILPYWPEIYVNDPERPQTPTEAKALSHAIGKAYRALGYSLVEVPELPVEKRVQFILSTIDKTTSGELSNQGKLPCHSG